MLWHSRLCRGYGEAPPQRKQEVVWYRVWMPFLPCRLRHKRQMGRRMALREVSDIGRIGFLRQSGNRCIFGDEWHTIVEGQASRSLNS